ncbi:hypothetical protein [Microbacterium sp. NPDC055683]
MGKSVVAAAVGVAAAVMVLAGCASAGDPAQAMAEAYLDPNASEEAHTQCDGETGTGGLWAQTTERELVETRTNEGGDERIFDFDATDTDGRARSLWVTVQLDDDGHATCVWGAGWYD